MYSAEQLVDLLKDYVLVVNFVKVDGDVREMRCTLKKDVLESAGIEYKPQLLQEDRIDSPNLAVWDLDANDWRSFRIANVQTVRIEGNGTGQAS